MSNLRTSRNLLFIFIGALLFIVAARPAAQAQSTTATLSGTVTDERGAVIPGATVTVENINTRLRRQATTNGEGAFTIPLLPPNTYLVRVEGQGFAPAQISDVMLNVNDQVALNIQLKVGQIGGDTVTVDADSSLVDESPSVTTTVDRQFVENLPLNGRSFQSLLTLTPGTVLTKVNAFDQGQFSVNGQRADANYFTVDGVSANIGIPAGGGLGQGGAGANAGFTTLGGTNGLVSVDALQEFKMQTSTYAPEFGRTSGGQIQIVTRSGSNDFHGSVFNYFRNDVLDANDWFGNSRRLKKPALRQNDFGGVFSGPILLPRFGGGSNQLLYDGRDRTFFFFSYEGLRLRQPQVGITEVPSLATRQSALPQIKPFLNAFPLPNGPVTSGGLAQFSASFSTPSTLNATSIRIDHTVNNRLTVFGRYNYAPSETQARQTLPSRSLSNVFQVASKIRTMTVGATYSITSKVVNDLRANYSKTNGSSFFFLDNFGGAVIPPDSTLFPSFTSSGNAFFGFTLLGGTNPLYSVGKNADNFQRQFNIVDSLSILIGSHQLKTGIDYRRLSPIFGPNSYQQSAFFDSAAVATTDIAIIISLLANTTSRFPVFTNFSAYAQDTWRVDRRLTLTYGLRWEYNPPPIEKRGNDPAVLIGLDSPAALALAPRGTPLWNATYNNFAPRVGVAYQLSQSPGKETLLRGGFGVFYDLGNGQASEAFGNVYPYISASTLLASVRFPLSPAQSAPPPIGQTTRGAIFFAFDPNLKLPYTLQWNFAVEQSLGANQTLTASYVGAAGRRLLRLELLNNPNANFSTVRITRNTSTSDYHALQLQFQHRLTRGLQALASYTWSKSLDTGSSDSFVSPPAARYDPNQDRGPSDFDVRHSFAAAVTYNIPTSAMGRVADAILGNYSLDTIFRARSATPVNVITGTDILGFGLTSVTRPNLISGIPLYINDSTVAGGRRINRAAFAIPPAGTQGTLGRNALRGFPVYQVDMALRRQFSLTERLKLQFRAELFNVFNHPNFADPNNSFASPVTFGQSTLMLGRSLQTGGAGGGFNTLYQIGGPRSGQLALKIIF